MRIWQLLSDDSGANIIEYALLMSLIGIALMTVIFPTIRDAVGNVLTDAATILDGAR